MFKFSYLLFLLVSIFTDQAKSQIKFSSDIIGQIKKNEVAENQINLGNSIFKIPEEQLGLIVRPDIKYTLDNLRVVLRPELTLENENTVDQLSQNKSTRSESEVDIKDLFIQWDAMRNLSLIVGLQSFQWGPAELLSPSNPIFHFDVNQKSFFYKQKGKVILRLNFNPDKQNSIVGLIEPISNQEAEFVYNDQFSAKGLLKYEYTFNSSASYIGAVAGFEEQENFFVGSYFNYAFNDQFSFYFDGKVSQYQIHLKPMINGSLVDFNPVFDEKKQWHSLATVGLRSESDFDVRLEYIYNTNGYNKDDFELAKASLAQIFNPNIRNNVNSFFRPGLELLGQSYIYVSARVTDFWTIKDINLYSRYFYSLQDQSGLFQFETDKSFGDSWTGLVGASVSVGEKETEFLLMNLWTVSAGLKWSY